MAMVYDRSHPPFHSPAKLTLAAGLIGLAALGAACSRDGEKAPDARTGTAAQAVTSAGTMFVSYTTANTDWIVQLDAQGNLLNQFGARPQNFSYYSHLALSGGKLYRSTQFGSCPAGSTPGTIDEFALDGTLLRTISTGTSPSRQDTAIASDFSGQSLLFSDLCAGTTTIFHLDDDTTGASSPFTAIPYGGAAGIQDMYFSGGSLFAFALTAPPNSSRIARLNAQGSITYFDSPLLILPFQVDVGSVAVDPNSGEVFAATTSDVVRFDAAGNVIGSFPFPDTRPSLDIDASGNLNLGRFASGVVSVITPGGTPIRDIQLPVCAARVLDVAIVPGSPAGGPTGTPFDPCPPADQCHVSGSCDATTGTCAAMAAPDGTPCDDGNACTTGDTCQAGACVGGSAVVCAAIDQCHVAGACNASTGLCSNPPVPDGTACSTGTPCVVGEVCQGGSCGGGGVSPTCGQTCITIQRGLSGTVADALINSGDGSDGGGNVNYGSSQALAASVASTGQRQGLLFFDLSQIPAGAVVASATVTLDVYLYGGAPVRAHRVTAPWNESTVTWNNFGEAFYAGVEATFPAATGSVPNGTPVTADLTSLVQSWVSGTYPNDGILLERDAGATVFMSSEYAAAPAARPQITVCYIP